MVTLYSFTLSYEFNPAHPLKQFPLTISSASISVILQAIFKHYETLQSNVLNSLLAMNCQSGESKFSCKEIGVLSNVELALVRGILQGKSV